MALSFLAADRLRAGIQARALVPEHDLAIAVIATAVRDARRGIRSAREWLETASPERTLWFSLANLKEPPDGWRLPGVPHEDGKRRINRLRVIEAIRRAAPGAGCRAIAAAAGVCPTTVWRIKRKLGL